VHVTTDLLQLPHAHHQVSAWVARAAHDFGAAGAMLSCGVAAAACIGVVDDSTTVVVVGGAAALADESGPGGNAANGFGGMGASPGIPSACEDGAAAAAACAPPGERLAAARPVPGAYGCGLAR